MTMTLSPLRSLADGSPRARGFKGRGPRLRPEGGRGPAGHHRPHQAAGLAGSQAGVEGSSVKRGDFKGSFYLFIFYFLAFVDRGGTGEEG